MRQVFEVFLVRLDSTYFLCLSNQLSLSFVGSSTFFKFRSSSLNLYEKSNSNYPMTGRWSEVKIVVKLS